MNDEDIMVWPCGTWCYREELESMLSFMSDDYRTIKYDSKEWREFDKD